MVGLFKTNYIYRTAELGIFIGETENWRKGIGTEVVNLILNYAFNTLNFLKILVSVNATNTQSLKMFKKVGFVEEGHLKDMEFINGEWTDLKKLSIFKKDRNV